MRCDLHVHTLHSGPVDLPGLRHLSRECYSEPMEVYETAKRRGMDLVTITDHDTVEGALQLVHLPDFIVGEEVTLELGAGRQIHLGVWDLDGKRHEQLQARRRDPESLFAWLAEERLPACVNHPFSPLTGARDPADFQLAFGRLNLVETQNGMMPRATNEFAHRASRALGLAAVGGSDAHTLAGIGRAFTTVPRAGNRGEFLDGLRAGFTVPAGDSGSYARLTSDVIRVLGGALLENLRKATRSIPDLARCLATVPLASMFGLVPLVTLANFAKECWGGRTLHAAYEASTRLIPAGSRIANRFGAPLAFGGER